MRPVDRVASRVYVMLEESELWFWEHSRHFSLDFVSGCGATCSYPTHCVRGLTNGLLRQEVVFPF